MFQTMTHTTKRYLRPSNTYAFLVTCQVLPEVTKPSPRPSQPPAAAHKAKRGRLHASQRWAGSPSTP